jgi:hypothetical protein
MTKQDNLLHDGRGGGRGAELYDTKKAWTSINHSILSGLNTYINEKPMEDLMKRMKRLKRLIDGDRGEVSSEWSFP